MESSQVPIRNLTLVAVPASLADPIRQAVWEIDTNQPISAVAALEQALAGAGLALGVAASLVLTRALSSLLYSTSVLDPWVFSAVALLIVVVALEAGFLPAQRATWVQPTEVLRYESARLGSLETLSCPENSTFF